MMKASKLLVVCLVLLVIGRAFAQQAAPSAIVPSAKDYPTIQEALRANPGRTVFVPAGDYEISEKIRIRADNSGLFGPGRIVQTNPDAPIVEIEGASGVRLRDLTLTRSEGRMETRAEGVVAIRCRDIALEDLRVLDNRSPSAAIALRECRAGQVRGCLVQNYMRVSVDDRTRSGDWGYAFNCIDGTGISATGCKGVLIQGNRVIENHLLPTPEIQKKFQLGKFVKKNPQKGFLANQKAWDEGYVSNWHQGSAIIVSSPEVSDCTQVLGNYIENAAQGIDIHADHVIVAQNIINNAFIGMKAMHGSRNILIIGNQFVKNDLWSIGLMPGAASHPALPAAGSKPEEGDRHILPNGKGDRHPPNGWREPVPSGKMSQSPAQEANVDGGSIIANNIISDFGYGNAHWVWGDEGSPIKFDTGQKPDDPPLTDVIIQGNIVYDTGRDQALEDGAPKVLPPRYKYAVCVARSARGLHFANNILHPGTAGVSNVELKP